MTRREKKLPIEADPSQFLVLPCPVPTPGTFRVNNRLLTVRICTGCGLRTTIPGLCVVCGSEVVGPKYPGPVPQQRQPPQGTLPEAPSGRHVRTSVIDVPWTPIDD